MPLEVIHSRFVLVWFLELSTPCQQGLKPHGMDNSHRYYFLLRRDRAASRAQLRG